jgi:hypothetical protein
MTSSGIFAAGLCLALATLPRVSAQSQAAAGDPALDIVRKSLGHDEVNLEKARDYTFNEHVVERKGDGNGGYKVKDTETYETVILYGQPFQKLIAKNDKPLSASEQKKEQERFDKEVDKRRRKKEEADASGYDKEREQHRKVLKEVLNAYTFRLVGEEKVDGKDAYVISAVPRPDYRPQTREGKWLQGLQGQIWIDKQELQWVKVEAKVIRPLKWGFFIATLAPGSSLYFEQRRVNDEVWLPRQVVVRVRGRFTFAHYDMEAESDYSNYRKFHADAKMIGAGAEPAR